MALDLCCFEGHPERTGTACKLSPIDKEKVKVGTLLAVRTAAAAEVFHGMGRPFIIEQPLWKDDPSSVSMFNLDEFQELLQHQDVRHTILDQCMFDAKTTKPTSLLHYMIDKDPTVNCNRPKKMWTKPSAGERVWASHPPLKGKEWYIDSREGHRGMLLKPWEASETFRHEPYLTAAAQAYPDKLNKKFAETILKVCNKSEKNQVQHTQFEVVGKWRDVLKRKCVEPHATSTRPRLEFTAPLRGKDKKDVEDNDDRYWGGMRNPRYISMSLPGYRTAGAVIYAVLQEAIRDRQDLLAKCRLRRCRC